MKAYRGLEFSFSLKGNVTIFHLKKKKKKTATEERVANLRKHTTQILLLSVLKDRIIFQNTWKLFLKRAHHSARNSLFNVMDT